MEKTPKELGFIFPAEFEPQEATWLSWPHKEASWPGKIKSIFPAYSRFVAVLSKGQKVCINVADSAMKVLAERYLEEAGADLRSVEFYLHPTNDAWCRDHGPSFLVNHQTGDKMIVDWVYNSWGGKYPPYDLDDNIPTRIALKLGLPVAYPGIVMEGGSVDFNGRGTVLTTTSCLLHKNRNPKLSKLDIEKYLIDYYCVTNVLWLGEGIVGDDTDGHIDDIARFVSADTVVVAIEEDPHRQNYHALQTNLRALQQMRLENGQPIKIVTLPMPTPVVVEGQELPASYANFYIANKHVIVPTFRDEKNDKTAIDILQRCFPTREVVGVDSVDVIWGLGSWHCLSQQEPAVTRH